MRNPQGVVYSPSLSNPATTGIIGGVKKETTWLTVEKRVRIPGPANEKAR
jgi:hypothetical protein